MRKQKKILLVLLIALLAIALVVVFFNMDKWFSGGSVFTGNRYTKINGVDYRPKNLIHALVIGTDSDQNLQDSGSYNNTSCADFIALVSVNLTNRSYSVLQLNRDTMADIDVLTITGQKSGQTVREQLALSYAYGNGLNDSCVNTKSAVSRLLYGLDIDFYIALSPDALRTFNDELGGVDVTFDADYTDIDSSFTLGNTVKLNGEQALKLVRSRMAVQDGTNLNRMNRQKLYMNSLLEQVKNGTFSDQFWINLFTKLSDDSSGAPLMITNNISSSTLNNLLGYLKDFSITGLYSPEGVADYSGEFVEFNLSHPQFEDLIIELYFDRVK